MSRLSLPNIYYHNFSCAFLLGCKFFCFVLTADFKSDDLYNFKWQSDGELVNETVFSGRCAQPPYTGIGATNGASVKYYRYNWPLFDQRTVGYLQDGCGNSLQEHAGAGANSAPGRGRTCGTTVCACGAWFKYGVGCINYPMQLQNPEGYYTHLGKLHIVAS